MRILGLALALCVTLAPLEAATKPNHPAKVKKSKVKKVKHKSPNHLRAN